jgi:hypothetical protein
MDYKTVSQAIRDSHDGQSDWIRDALVTKATPGGGGGARG